MNYKKRTAQFTPAKHADQLLDRFLAELASDEPRAGSLRELQTAWQKLGRTAAERLVHRVRVAPSEQWPLLAKIPAPSPALIEMLQEAAQEPTRYGEGPRALLEAAGAPSMGPMQQALLLLTDATVTVPAEEKMAEALLRLLRPRQQADAEPWLWAMLEHPSAAIVGRAEELLSRWYGRRSEWVVRGPLTGDLEIRSHTVQAGMLHLLVARAHKLSGWTMAQVIVVDDEARTCTVQTVSNLDMERYQSRFRHKWPSHYMAARLQAGSAVEMPGWDQVVTLLSPTAAEVPAHPTLVLADAPIFLLEPKSPAVWELWSFFDVVKFEDRVEQYADAEELLRGEIEASDNTILAQHLLDMAWTQQTDEPELAAEAVGLARDLLVTSIPPAEHPVWRAVAQRALDELEEEQEESDAESDDEIDWEYATIEVPVQPPVSEQTSLEEAVETLAWGLESGTSLAWEAVIRREQMLYMSPAHERAEAGVPETFERTLYINGVPRPTESWETTIKALATRLHMPRFVTFEPHAPVMTRGWLQLATAIEAYCHELDLGDYMDGDDLAIDALGDSLHAALWLQTTFAPLEDLGQAGVPPLSQSPERLAAFLAAIEEAAEHADMSAWTLAEVLEILVLPATDRATLLAWFSAEIGMEADEPLVDAVLETVEY